MPSHMNDHSSKHSNRYMGLSDLMKEIKLDPQSFLGDESVEIKVLGQVLQLVEDKISEVKNQAVKCLGQLIKIIRESQMELVVDRLTEFSSSADEELRDISGLALKTITAELPTEGTIAVKACAKLTPKLLTQLATPEIPPDTLIETLSILSILVTHFPAYVSNLPLSPSPIQTITPLLAHPRPAVRKRAIITLSQFVPLSAPELSSQLLSTVINPNLSPSAPVDKQRTTVNLVAAISRASPHQLASSLGAVIPGILRVVDLDDEELREGALQALESIVLRMPVEVTPFLGTIIQVATKYIKFDPNYAGGEDDEDEEMLDEDEEADGDLDEWSDEEDQSYKIRRSATKLLASIIATRPELLVPLYKEVSPVLISRFGDREETVRLEIWATYVTLLTQTRLYGGGSQTRDSVGVKRKRTPDGSEFEETAYSLLQSQNPTATLQAGFGLLHTLLQVLPGSLSSQTGLIVSILKTILSQSSSTSNSTLHISCLQFTSSFFASHPPPTFANSLPALTPVLLKTLGEKHPRIASETFKVFSSLLGALKPVKGQDWVEAVYQEAIARLVNHATDAEVRSSAEDVIGDLWLNAPDIVTAKGGQEWEHVCRTTGRTDGAVKVVTRVAHDADISEQWVNSCVDWAIKLLTKNGRTGKAEVFECLSMLLSRYENGVPANLLRTLIPQLKSYVSSTDISLQSQALSLFALLLQLSPKSTFLEVEREVLEDVYGIAYSPLTSGAALDSVLAFFGALVEADFQIATHVVSSLTRGAPEKPKGDVSYPNVAKCVAQVVRSYQALAAGVIAEFSKTLKLSMSLLILGEIGRFIDMSPQHDVFNGAIELFASDQEDVRTAAAFAAGNIAIGNLHLFLPVVVQLAKQDDAKRLLALHALKEVVTHTSTSHLENLAETLWVPLFENSESADESSRGVAAACIGKLITTHPARYLPQVHARIRDPNAATRATVLSAIRYTFVDSSSTFDEVLAPYLLDFLSLMEDTELSVRQLALSVLNAAARTKPHLLRDHLHALLPALYQETIMKTELVRTVQMGPWQHKVDDGLEARKTAYETLYTLLDTSLTKLDLNELLTHVLVGLADGSDEIKVICHMILFRLAPLAPTAVAQRLGEATPLLEASMKGPAVGKDTVKQDLERAAELQRSTLRAVAALSKIAGTGAAPRFDAWVAELKKSEWRNELNELLGA
ncbi:TIP120-domain-containing protein [Multifurca ochricompacta]|uniref:TIP120-domain-containing protein n=1 Tax=Multifurca ochricompacta TaxID=376703 RepID=A0AAD4MEE5_9AGAM|nr:TIP120-domain-containing protein [Multifurca ochricompacta]